MTAPDLDRDALASTIGKQLLDAADTLATFLGTDYLARFPIRWGGRAFWIKIELEQDHD